MKLSEAILLGSTVVTPKAGRLHFSGENSGCVLGMAAVATGCSFVRPLRQIPVEDLRTVNSEEVFGIWLLRVVRLPCECEPASIPPEMRIKDIIAHLFDCHVMDKQNWTLDQLASWVASWEPKEAHPASFATPFEDAFLDPQRFYAEAAAWQRTRDDFISKHRSKRHRGARSPGIDRHAARKSAC
jgi:hypothetical protein